MSKLHPLFTSVGLVAAAALCMPSSVLAQVTPGRAIAQDVGNAIHLGTYQLSDNGQITPLNPDGAATIWDNTASIGSFRSTVGEEAVDVGDLPDGTIVGGFQIGFATDATGSVSFRYSFYDGDGFDSIGGLLPTNSGGTAAYDITVDGLAGGGIFAYTVDIVLPVEDHFIITGPDVDMVPGTDWSWGYVTTDAGNSTLIGPLITGEGPPPGAPGRADFFDVYTPDVATGAHSGTFFFGGNPFAQFHMLLTQGSPFLADVSVALTSDAPSNLGVGQQFTYTVTGSNAGPGDATDLIFNLLLSNKTSFVSSDCGAASAGNSVSWTVPSLAVAATTACNITVAVVASGDLLATASVNSATPDPNLVNNSTQQVVGFQAVQVPTLGQFGLLLIGLLFAGIAAVVIRRS